MAEPEVQLNESIAPEPPARPKKGGLVKTAGLLVVVLSLLGGGAWWYLGRTAHAEAKEPPLESRGLIKFEPFLVNLADAGGSRFLKASVDLVVATEAEAAHVEEAPVVQMHMRSAILELLTQESAAALVTPEGKAALKAAIKDKTGKFLEHGQVVDVLFSEFVVQF